MTRQTKKTLLRLFHGETSRGTDSTTNAESSLNSRTLLQMSWTSRTPKSESMQIPNLPVSRRRFIPSVFFWRVTWGNTENVLKSWVDFPGAQLLPFFKLVCPEPYCVRWICWQSQRRLLSWAEWLWTRRSRNDKTTNPYQLPIPHT